jgi:hypothetical protein
MVVRLISDPFLGEKCNTSLFPEERRLLFFGLVQRLPSSNYYWCRWLEFICQIN